MLQTDKRPIPCEWRDYDKSIISLSSYKIAFKKIFLCYDGLINKQRKRDYEINT